MFAAKNQLLTPPQGVVSVAYDAVGTGLHATGSTKTLSASETHTATAGAYVLVWVEVAISNGTISSVTGTYGGVTMTVLSTIHNNNSSTSGEIVLLGLANVAGGAQTVSVTATSTSVAITSLAGGSTSYLNVGSVGTITTGSGSTTSLTVSATGAANNMVAAAFGANQSSALTFGTFSKTQRYVHNSTGSDSVIVIGDTAITGALTFTDTVTGTAPFWSGIAAVLNHA